FAEGPDVGIRLDLPAPQLSVDDFRVHDLEVDRRSADRPMLPGSLERILFPFRRPHVVVGADPDRDPAELLPAVGLLDRDLREKLEVVPGPLFTLDDEFADSVLDDMDGLAVGGDGEGFDDSM